MSLRRLHLVTLPVMLALSLSLAGCGSGDVKSEVSTTTTGQELMDLKKAYESGAMSEKEYEREKKKILER